MRALELLIEAIDRDKLYAGVKGASTPNPSPSPSPLTLSLPLALSPTRAPTLTRRQGRAALVAALPYISPCISPISPNISLGIKGAQLWSQLGKSDVLMIPAKYWEEVANPNPNPNPTRSPTTLALALALAPTLTLTL